MSLGSPEQALELYTEALELMHGGIKEATLLEAAAEAALRAADGQGRAREFARAAMSIFEDLGDHDGAGRAACLITRSLASERKNSEALEFAVPIYEAFGDDVSKAVRARLATLIANGYGHGLDPHKSLVWSEIGLSIAEELGDTSTFAAALGARAATLFGLGRPREAIMLARGMKALAADAGDYREEASATMGIGLFYLPDDPRASIAASFESAEICRRYGLRGIERNNLLNAAEVGVTLGTWSESRRILLDVSSRGAGDQANWVDMLLAMIDAMSGDLASAEERLRPTFREGTNELEFLSGATTELHALAVVKLASGDLAEARRLAAKSIEIDPTGINAAVAIHVLGRATLWQRDVSGAKDALAAGRKVRGRWTEAVLATIEAGISALEGDIESASKQYNVAFESWRALDCTLPLALAELDCAVLFGATSPDPEATREAKEIFEQLGAGPFLTRLEEAVAETPPERG
jgi:tetratricopeptide (TPR) repeat protein